jgi:hypothetical protein
LEERLTRAITVMEIIKLSSTFEVHRSRFRSAVLFEIIESRRRLELTSEKMHNTTV